MRYFGSAGGTAVMASIEITQVKNKKGIRFKARVKNTKKGVVEKSEGRTFDTRPQAANWAKKKKAEFEYLQDNPQSIEQEQQKLEHATISTLIYEYLNDPINLRKYEGSDKYYVLQRLAISDLGTISAHKITAKDLERHCKQRISSPTSPSPATVMTDVIYLKTVMDVAEDEFGIEANTDYHDKAYKKLVEKGLIGRSKGRTRRPTSTELDRIMGELKKREVHSAAHIPYSSIVPFSILSCLRIGELCDVKLSDYDADKKTLLVRDRKHPTKKIGNDMALPLCNEMVKIIESQPKSDDGRIFPYNSRSVTAGWQRVRNKLGITDLCYRDLRAEGASRLLEQGLDVSIVAKITGHKDFRILQEHYNRIQASDISKMLNKIRQS
ncbi:Belongs to the 'phage' integrase family [Vibrio crassostreae]|nr:Belongs to the 'phage' integrase family [Vibrio crassostreae]CAK1947404.1 Belongs to the 'phage' integrase family [Vibrio crassostreae]CAK2013371.1 Belongs to the 'phage' integrase family [Vibrio crassostreae]CAK2329401.1 Belongs to the 'phage' integrase family [Vibrio crassostreae]CAK2329909.1 Belongs to the 'phage' integrase family [Vibrio crassostreae]